MATKPKTEKKRPKSLNTTFNASSINSSVIEEMLFREPEAEEDDDGPVVFICGKCKLAVGDSLAWDGSEDSQNQIRLKRVTDNVLIGKESRLFEASKRSPCLVVDLICRGCLMVIGMVYTSTPRNMDHKRFTFCLSVADIDSYVLGSARQMLAAEGTKEQLVTLERRGVVEQLLTEMKTLVVTMAQRTEEIEAGLEEGK